MKRLFLLYGPVLFVVAAALSVLGVFHLADLFFLDRAFNWRGAQEPRPEVTLVAISQEDFETGAPRWPWPRSFMARLIDEIASYGPAVIAIDILYTEQSTTETVFDRELFEEIRPYLYQILAGRPLTIQTREGTVVIGPGHPGFDALVEGAEHPRLQDAELADAIRRATDQGVNVILAAQSVTGIQVAGIVQSYPELRAAVDGPPGLVDVRPDPDGVLRHYHLYNYDMDGRVIYTMALTTVAGYKGVDLPPGPLPNGDVPIGDDLVVPARDGRFLVNFAGPTGTYPTVIARDLFRPGHDLAHLMTGKIVVIGVTDPAAEDLFATPFSGDERMAGVEFQAGAIDTLLSSSFIHTLPQPVVLLVMLLFGVAAIALGRFLRPAVGFGGALALLLVLFGVWMGLFAGLGYFLPIASPLAVAVLGYVFAVADRSGVEQLEKMQARNTLSKYLTPAVVEEMLRSPEASLLGGKRAELTILFSDIRGFTTTSERLMPEEVVALLNEYLTIMTDIIFKYEGTVDKFEGDAILAFWGAPKAHDDDPDRAVQTAIEMRRALEDLQARWESKAGASLRIGVGINTGPVVVGNIGSERRMDYTIIGDAVNLAARIQDMTKEHGVSILISGSTHDQLTNTYQLRPLGSADIRGRQQAVLLYEVIGHEAAVLTGR